MQLLPALRITFLQPLRKQKLYRMWYGYINYKIELQRH